jgi:tetratricopeptide (TPR) repeat protein
MTYAALKRVKTLKNKNMKHLKVFFLLLLVSSSASAQTDSTQVRFQLLLLVQAGDSCMQQYNTFEALKYYQEAYAIAKTRSQQLAVEQPDLPLDKFDELPEEKQDEIIEHLKQSAEKSSIVDCMVQMKLANCHYKRANYRQASDILKLVPEDSLSHESFRQLAFSYQKQGDNDSFIYWASQLVNRYPMDGEVVANLILAYAKNNQPQNGIICGLKYSLRDSTNIPVNRALADAWIMNGDFTAAGKLYNRLLEQGDSTFKTLYSAGLCYSKIKDLERAYTHLSAALTLSQMQHAGAAWRLGVVCVDTKRYEEGLAYLSLARELLRPDTTVMKAITLSEGEGYYMTEHYQEAITAWKEHLAYNPTSIATYYNLANAYLYCSQDGRQAKEYYERFLALARKEEKPTEELSEMIEKADSLLRHTNWGKVKSQRNNNYNE